MPFLLCFTLSWRAIFQVQALGGLYSEGRFNGGFFVLPVWRTYIWRGSDDTWRGLFSEFYGISIISRSLSSMICRLSHSSFVFLLFKN